MGSTVSQQVATERESVAMLGNRQFVGRANGDLGQTQVTCQTLSPPSQGCRVIAESCSTLSRLQRRLGSVELDFTLENTRFLQESAAFAMQWLGVQVSSSSAFSKCSPLQSKSRRNIQPTNPFDNQGPLTLGTRCCVLSTYGTQGQMHR